jgi:acyl dehydratase
MTAPRALPLVSTALPSLAVGPIDADWVFRYVAASGDDNPLHLNPAAARAAGFSGSLVPGMLLLGLCERAIHAWRDDAGISRLAARFLHPLVVPASVTVSGRVVLVEPAGDAARVVLRLFVGAAQSPPACIAEAVLRVPAP